MEERPGAMTPEPKNQNSSHGRPARKERIRRELVSFSINFVYLAIFFTAVAWYRRLILEEYQISYLHYGTAAFEALILAKVIWLAELLGLDRKRGTRPLLYTTVYKTLVFSAFVALFAIIEHMIGGLVEGIGVRGGLAKLWHEGKFELIARFLVTFCAFIPFFAFRELGKVLGPSKLRDLFLRNRGAAELGAAA
jgi:hypothetical protein